MIDLYCPHCGEPWDNDEFHVDGQDYRDVFLGFKAYGCPVAEAAMDGNAVSEIHQPCQRDPIFGPKVMSALRGLWAWHDYADDIASGYDLVDWYADD